MKAALVDRFLKLIPDANRRAFDENQLSHDPKMNFLNAFNYFWMQFGDATEEEIVKNTAKLLDPWQPQEGIEVLVGRFNKSQIFAFFARDQINDKTLITYFLIPIKKSGRYIRAYEDWLAKPDNQKTYAILKEFWREEHLKMKRSNPTAKQYEYGGNATAEQDQQTATILEQCANAMLQGQRQQQERQTQF